MPSKSYKSSHQTKNNILQKALELFNESGTASVSMNALAEALGISAGNLHYHYKSKEEVIRAIYELMFSEWDVIYGVRDECFNLRILRGVLRKNFELTWKYRFFYREYAALLRNDVQLSKRFRAIQEQRVSDQVALIKRLAEAAGGGSAFDPKEIRNVAHIGWILANTWLCYIESTGRKIKKAVLEEAVEMMLLYYKPYLFSSLEYRAPTAAK